MHRPDGRPRIALAFTLDGAEHRTFPFGLERLDDRRLDQPFDIGARGVMCAQPFSLVLVERLFEQGAKDRRSEEHTSELQSLMRISYAVFCLKKKKIYAAHTINK